MTLGSRLILSVWYMLWSLAFVGSVAAAGKVQVVTTLPVLHSVAVTLGDGIDELDVQSPLMSGGASPHHFDLKPSQARALRDAELMIWIGPSLETALAQVVGKFVPENRQLAVETVEGLDLLAYPNKHGGATPKPDPHFWLDPTRMRVVAGAVAQRLTVLVSDGAKAKVARNLEGLLVSLDGLAGKMTRELAPLKMTTMLATHDALRYVADRAGLMQLEVMETHHDHKPKLSVVMRIRRRLESQGLYCVVSDSGGAEWASSFLGKRSRMPIVEIDVLGVGLKPGRDFYPKLVDETIKRLKACEAVATAQ